MRVAVLGAGLQGACAALALAERGVRVDLFEKHAEPMTQASAQNEGKIHLGYVYGHDRSGRSARLMIRGALSFAPLLRRWVGASIDALGVSSSFLYAVHRDSLLTVDEVRAHFRACHEMATEEARDGGSDYFGRDLRQPPRELSTAERVARFDDRTVRAAFDTPEIAIDPQRLASLMRLRLRTGPGISLRLETTVRRLTVHDRGVCVAFDSEGRSGCDTYDHVVNALWEDRLAIDASAGIAPSRPAWLWRFKYFLRVDGTQPVDVPSVTVVLGPFGDVVNYGQGSLYLSWYPTGCIMRSGDARPPALPRHTPVELAAIRQGIRAGVQTIVPAVADMWPEDLGQLQGGLIFAWGATDITDPTSGLHERFEVGVRSHGRLHTIDTGKLTTAPLFAADAAERITSA